MNNVFDGLEELGFQETSKINIYEGDDLFTKEKRESIEKDSTYDKQFDCPVCGAHFTEKIVRVGKQRLIRTESDLRPVYQYFEPYKYDIVLCNHCGYASMVKNFDSLTSNQKLLIKTKITPKYKPLKTAETYDSELAIIRYKLALLNAVVKKAKSSEKAVLCLKIKWLFESQLEKETQVSKKDNNKINTYVKQKNLFTEQALKGLIDTFGSESFPANGLEEATAIYLIAEFYRTLGYLDKSYLWFSKLITARNVSYRLKEKARDQVDLIRKAKAKLK